MGNRRIYLILAISTIYVLGGPQGTGASHHSKSSNHSTTPDSPDTVPSKDEEDKDPRDASVGKEVHLESSKPEEISDDEKDGKILKSEKDEMRDAFDTETKNVSKGIVGKQLSADSSKESVQGSSSLISQLAEAVSRARGSDVDDESLTGSMAHISQRSADSNGDAETPKTRIEVRSRAESLANNSESTSTTPHASEEDEPVKTLSKFEQVGIARVPERDSSGLLSSAMESPEVEIVEVKPLNANPFSEESSENSEEIRRPNLTALNIAMNNFRQVLAEEARKADVGRHAEYSVEIVEPIHPVVSKPIKSEDRADVKPDSASESHVHHISDGKYDAAGNHRGKTLTLPSVYGGETVLRERRDSSVKQSEKAVPMTISGQKEAQGGIAYNVDFGSNNANNAKNSKPHVSGFDGADTRRAKRLSINETPVLGKTASQRLAQQKSLELSLHPDDNEKIVKDIIKANSSDEDTETVPLANQVQPTEFIQPNGYIDLGNIKKALEIAMARRNATLHENDSAEETAGKANDSDEDSRNSSDSHDSEEITAIHNTHVTLPPRQELKLALEKLFNPQLKNETGDSDSDDDEDENEDSTHDSSTNDNDSNDTPSEETAALKLNQIVIIAGPAQPPSEEKPSKGPRIGPVFVKDSNIHFDFQRHNSKRRHKPHVDDGSKDSSSDSDEESDRKPISIFAGRPPSILPHLMRPPFNMMIRKKHEGPVMEGNFQKFWPHNFPPHHKPHFDSDSSKDSSSSSMEEPIRPVPFHAKWLRPPQPVRSPHRMMKHGESDSHENRIWDRRFRGHFQPHPFPGFPIFPHDMMESREGPMEEEPFRKPWPQRPPPPHPMFGPFPSHPYIFSQHPVMGIPMESPSEDPSGRLWEHQRPPLDRMFGVRSLPPQQFQPQHVPELVHEPQPIFPRDITGNHDNFASGESFGRPGPNGPHHVLEPLLPPARNIPPPPPPPEHFQPHPPMPKPNQWSKERAEDVRDEDKMHTGKGFTLTLHLSCVGLGIVSLLLAMTIVFKVYKIMHKQPIKDAHHAGQGPKDNLPISYCRLDEKI
ncbi:hypothetical protein DdX_05544 [Ditylenchus destructor]|uniref:Uncharacterized protein n=1 Tax=Ditylenchus destructor TaxID=166010 RepID=A0AAD4N6C4_9BILA|nr:hypothetical protein DdX_05544 [Ditylenchus destructor]